MTWKDEILKAWRQTTTAPTTTATTTAFPLVQQDFEDDEILAMVEVILSGRLTMGDKVRSFETAFAHKVGARHAVMVNSGSSANLLAVAAVVNPAARARLAPGDEVLVPAVCWSTSVWPLIQCGLVPVFVDVDPATLNVDLEDLRARIGPRTRGLMAVHILGNAADVGALLDLAAQHDLVVIEDTCESLGSTHRGRALGTFGRFGTYSFYFSHHMTTGEGGMVVCDDDEDAALLRCLRAHGWSRDQPDRAAIEARHADVDPRFLFINVGFNLRPMEVQAALGLAQLARLDAMNRVRRENHARVVAAFEAHPRWKGQLRFPVAGPGVDPAWFGFPALLEGSGRPLSTFLAALGAARVENRPIVSGNFARQPALALHGVVVDPAAFAGAEVIHHRGFFVGLHTRPLDTGAVDFLVDAVLKAADG